VPPKLANRCSSPTDNQVAALTTLQPILPRTLVPVPARSPLGREPCLTPQTHGKDRQYSDTGTTRQLHKPLLLSKKPAETHCLKIVVSPVRVRVSPSEVTANRRFLGRGGRRLRALIGTSRPKPRPKLRPFIPSTGRSVSGPRSEPSCSWGISSFDQRLEPETTRLFGVVSRVRSRRPGCGGCGYKPSASKNRCTASTASARSMASFAWGSTANACSA